MNIELIRAGKNDESRLKNLLSLYIHDFSEFLGMTPSEEGGFSYPALTSFLSEPNRAAYLIRSENRLVGFAFVSKGSLVSGDPAVFDLSEFFIVRGVRRRGVGRAAALELFRLHTGKWEVRVAEFNAPARKFWRDAIEHCVGDGITVDPWTRADGSRWNVCRFVSTGPRGSLFDAIGGAAGVERLAHAWHARVLADEVVSHAFSHGFHPKHTERLAAYWSEAWGGPRMFSDKLGSESSVVRMHSGNGPHEEMDRRAIDCFDRAMEDVAITDQELRRVLHDYFAWATTVSMSAYPRGKGDVPKDLRIPRWSWNGRQAD